MKLIELVRKSWSNPHSFWIGVGLVFLIQLTSLIPQTASYGVLALPITLASLLVSILLSGYWIESANFNFKKKKTIPSWKDWKNLFKNGLVSIGIAFIWVLPFLVFILLCSMLVINLGSQSLVTELGQFNITHFEALPPEQQITAITPLLEQLLPLLIVFFVFILIADFCIKMAQTHFAKHKKFKDSLQVKKILRTACTKEFFIAWLKVKLIGLLMILTISIPFGSIVLVPLLTFIIIIVETTWYVHAYHKAKL